MLWMQAQKVSVLALQMHSIILLLKKAIYSKIALKIVIHSV